MFFHQKHEMNSSDFFRVFIEGTSSLITLSPTLVDLALVSVIRAVDGQETGLSVQPAEKKNRLQTGQDFHQQSPLVQASLLLKHQPTGQLKRTRPLMSYPVSQSRVLQTNHEAGHVFSPTRKVGSAFFRTHVYCDYSPCFADLAWLSVVGFCGL